MAERLESVDQASMSMDDESQLASDTAKISATDRTSDSRFHDEGKPLIAEAKILEIQDLESNSKQPLKKKESSANVKFLAWTCVNTLATIAIVFTNKQIFKDASLRRNQSTFAAFHFAVTGATLYAASRPSVAIFAPQRAGFVEMMPLALAMCLNVILPNLSLAYSSVAFYQIVRVLLTPMVAIINFIFYGAKIPRQAAWCLIPICFGVGIVSYYDTRPARSKRIKIATTSGAGVGFALSGVVASSLYTVWIGTYHKKFNMNSMQLLLNQAPMSAFLLLYFIPFTDQTPDWFRIPGENWVLILFSGTMAAVINISQFFIVAGAGPVSSTVVGHLKTCSIVALGWMTSGRRTDDRGVFGILMAITGIIIYSVVMYQHRQAEEKQQNCDKTTWVR